MIKKKKYNKKTVLVFIIVLLFSCNKKSQTEFSLTGKTKEVEDGEILYLESNNKIIDSVRVENNTFHFTTKIPDHPIQVRLHTESFSNYTRLWIENKPMTLEATDIDFDSAIITGSETHTLSKNFYKSVASLSNEERRKKEKDFVKNHPNSIISAHILSVYKTTWGIEETKAYYEKFSVKNKVSEYGQQIREYINLIKEPEIGDPFIDFEMEDPNGNLKKLSDFKGKVVLLEFWASWCGPCRLENPNLKKTYNKFKSKGFEIFAVSLDLNKKDWLKAIEVDGVNWQHVSDLKGQSNKAGLIYGINMIPDNFLISEEGIIIGRHLSGKALSDKLSDILK